MKQSEAERRSIRSRIGRGTAIGLVVTAFVVLVGVWTGVASSHDDGGRSGEVVESENNTHRFDFGPGPTQEAYTKVSCSQQYNEPDGYGWESGVDGRDRNSFDILRKDFCVGDEMTFHVDLSNGWYHVKLISGDEIATQASTDVYANEALVLSDIGASAGEYAEEVLLVHVSNEQLTLSMHSNPARLNALEIAPAWKFDAGPGEVADDYTALRCDDAYDPSQGYGWLQTEQVEGTVQSSVEESLLHDYCFGDELSVVIDLVADEYEVTIISGDERHASEMTVSANGETLGEVQAEAGEYAHESFDVQISNGQLQLDMVSDSDGDPARINGLVIIPQLTFGEDETSAWPDVDGVVVEDHGSSVTVTNSEISFTLNKSNPTISALRKRGDYEDTNLFQHGRGYYLLNYVLDDESRSWGGSNMTYDLVTETEERVEISLSVDHPDVVPFVVDYRFVLEKDTPGVYVYSIFEYPEHMPHNAELEQSRYSFRANPDIFTHYQIEDKGVGNRSGEFPDPADIRAGETLMDATTRLPNGDVYTKYNHSVFVGDNRVNTILGENIALSLIRASDEYLVGGPRKQEYFMEQTTTTPMLHWYEQVRHYGVPNVSPDKGWSKIYGPFFLYVNEGENREALWDDVVNQTEAEQEKWPYNWLDHLLYEADSRAEVSGKLTITDGTSAEGARVTLADGDLPVYEQNLEYVYDVRAGEDGQFTIPHVRAGTYTLYADVDHLFGEFQYAEVTVAEGETLDLGELEWEPHSYGDLVWQIGEPDGTARQYKYGDELRQWGLWLQYPFDFPDDVDFTIGESDEAEDWNYLHPRIVTPGNSDHLLVPRDDTLAEWRIHFDHEAVSAGDATLTIAIAASDRGSLVVDLNGTEIAAYETIPPLENDAAVYRSGEAGYHRELEIPFDATLIEAGQNTITLRHMEDRPSGSTTAMMYDALKLEIDGQHSGDEPPFGLEHIRDLLEGFAQEGDVQRPLLPQLMNRIHQAIHHDNDGRTAQVQHHLQKFLDHLHHPQREDDSSAEAKTALNDAVEQVMEGE